MSWFIEASFFLNPISKISGLSINFGDFRISNGSQNRLCNEYIRAGGAL
jgi:hypothetical protein